MKLFPASTRRAILGAALALASVSRAEELKVDYRFAPHEWQAAICLPDDPHKTLVDRRGALLYHYRQGGREFGTRLSVAVAEDARWTGQQLLLPRVPLVRTTREAPGLKIVEEALAVTRLPAPPDGKSPGLRRLDGHRVQRDWAQPAKGLDPSLAHIALHYGGPLHLQIHTKRGGALRVALALCEGWWDEAGQRVQVLRVEGDEPETVDTVAELGKNRAGAFWFDARDTDGDGSIDVRIEAAEEAKDKNTVLNGLWAFEAGTERDGEALLAGKLTSAALVTLADAKLGGPARNDMILVHVTNTSKQARQIRPAAVVDTGLACEDRLSDQKLLIQGHETITASRKMLQVEAAEATRRVVRLEEVALEPGETAAFFVLYSGGGRIVPWPKTLEEALACREQAVAYWTNAPLPWGRVEVPDPQIQGLIDAAIRNIWQAREIKKGLPAFQVGPTCYRGLWIVDGAFLLEAATMLGAGDEARSGVKYTLAFQKEDGRFEILQGYHKENGIVIWTCLRHARLTQDKPWLESVWPTIEGAMDYIAVLRKQSLQNEETLDDGLMPPGFPDGGLGPRYCYEYTNTYWNLVGVRAAVEAARWLGKDDQARRWQRMYDDFYATFRKTAERDMRQDAHGNAYLPTYMGEAGKKLLPQRAQWSFCHAVYPGQLFDRDDPLVAGTLAMLEATEREGMVYGTGWDKEGLWNYFASFYGHAWLWQGEGRKAAQTLYAFANHAAPILAWREEQSPKGEEYKKVGDMPHNWASAEFVRLAVHLLALDRGDELHLFEGLPVEWTRPRMVTKLNAVATPFGPLTMELKIADDGRTAMLRVEPLADPSCKRIVVHLGRWASREEGARIELNPQQASVRQIAMERATD